METTVTIPDNFQWRFNHQTECWDKVVENSGTETWTAYQYNKETKAWDNVVTLTKKQSDGSQRATKNEYEHYYCWESGGEYESSHGPIEYYSYKSEEINKDLAEGISTNDGSTPGTVYKWNGNSWEQLTSLDSSKKTYFISHGMNNTYQMKWIRDMANTLATKDPNAQIITIDWGDWSSNGTNDLDIAINGATNTKSAAARAAILISQITGGYHAELSVSNITRKRIKVDLGLSGELNYIGHSHGAHVCGYLATFSSQEEKTLTGLDISEEKVHIPSGGISWNNTAAKTVYFYKSSPMYGGEKLHGHYNIAVIDDSKKIKIDGLLDDYLEFGSDTTGHGYAPEWYTLSIDQDKLAGYNITDAPYFNHMKSYFEGVVSSPWIGISDSTHKIECLDIGYVDDGNGKNKWDFEKYYNTLKAVDQKNPLFNKIDSFIFENIVAEEFRWNSLIRSVGYLTDFSVDNTSVIVENEITVGKDADIQFTIYNNADNISFTEDFIFDAQQNQDTTFQIWLSTTDKLDTTNTETSICIYEDALRVLPDDGGLENDNYFDFEESITISSESVNKLFKDFKTKGETDAYIFVRAGGKEGKGEFITGELYSKDNDSQGQLVHIKADQDIKYSFVIDDTGSMSNEIGAVRSGLLRFIDSLRASLEEGEAAPLMQLITFKDNVTHRITTSNLDEMYAAVSGLRATGGGDTPEYSNHAIAQAVRNIGTNGTILFATDAESHAGVNMNNVLAEARSKGVRINSIISGSVSSYSGGGYSYAAAPVSMMAMSSGDSAEEVTDPFGDSPDAAGSISVDSTTSGVVNYGENRYDWMKVYLKKDYTYSFALDTADNKKAFLNLYSSDGKTVIDEGNAGDIIYFSPTTSGTYYLRTRAFDYEDTSYSLNVAQTGEPSTIGTTLESFSILSTYTGGVYEVRSEVKSGDTTGYEAIIYNSLASTIGAAVISCGPYSAQKGSTLDVVISGYGTNWKAGETEVVFDSDKISTLSVTVISPTQLSATIEISSECSNGVYDVSVSTGAEKANGVDVLTVKTASSNPSLVSVVSSGFTQGGDFTATVRGNNTNWTEDSIVSMGPNITITSVEFVSSTELKVRGSVAEDASIGFRTVSVNTNGYSQSLSKAFFVAEKAPTAIPALTITGKTQLVAGTTVTLTFKGENITFIDGKTTVDIGDDISIIDISVVDINTITVTAKADKNIKLGFRDAKITVNGVSASLLNGLEIISKNNWFSGDTPEDLIFVKSNYSERTTGRKQNGVLLKYGENAFSTIDEVDQTTDKLIVTCDSKVDGNEYAGNLLVAACAAVPIVKENKNSYSYKANSTAKGTLNISQDTGKTEFIRFARVNVSDAAVGNIYGGNESSSEHTKTTVNKKGVVTDTAQSTYSSNAFGKFTANDGEVADVSGYSTVALNGGSVNELSGGTKKVNSSSKGIDAENKCQKTFSESENHTASGSVTLKECAFIQEIDGYSKVTLTDSCVGNVTNFTSKDSKNENATYDEAKYTVTRKVTLTHTETTAGTFKATDADSIGDVTGFATVTLEDVSSAGDFRRIDENGEKYCTVKETLNIKTNKNKSVAGTYNRTETFTRSGKFTATDSHIGNVENFSTVILSGSKAGDISNFITSKIVTKGTADWDDMTAYGRPEDYNIDLRDWVLTQTITEALNGSVTLKNGASAGSIANFKTVAITDSTVETIDKVSTVTVSKGDCIIGSYAGTDANDTFSIAKGAVLTAGSIDLGYEAKDKLSIAGTLILTGTEINAASITGKGEIAAASEIYADLDVDFANILNLGETAENFRGTAYENADDIWKKAVKWDGEEMYSGWMGSWDGYKSGSDNIDHIRFKAEAEDILCLTGMDDDSWTLLDKKGNEINDATIFDGNKFMAAGEYILQINSDEEKSFTYGIELA